jgi:hypothetical protein
VNPASRLAAFVFGVTAYTLETAAELTLAAFTVPGAVVRTVVHATETTRERR